MKTPAPQRAAGRKKLAAAGQALPDGSFPVPSVPYLVKAIRSAGRAPAAKRPALKGLIVRRAKELNAVNAPGVKGTWPFQGANDGKTIELVGPKGYVHGWIKAGGEADKHIALAKQADAEGRHADAINHLGTALRHVQDKSAAHHLNELKKEMAARQMGVPYKAKPLPARLHKMTPGPAKAATVSAGDAPEERAGKMSANAFRRGDSTQGALQGHRDAAKAHRQAAQLTSSAAQSAYHTRMASLHSRVASMRMTSNKASDQADALKSAGGFANDTEAISLATATARRIPVVRGAADVQLSRTAPGKITAMHKSSGLKIGVIAAAGKGYAGTHADGTATGASGSQQGALTGLIAYHNQAAKGFPAAQQGGTAVMPGAKAYANDGGGLVVDLASGPAPYHRDPDEDVQCPACKKYNAPDAKFCDQCGVKLPPEAYESAASLASGARAALDLAGSLPVPTPASSSSDGPRVTSAGAGAGGSSSGSGAPAGLSAYGAAVYKKLLAKKMKPGIALMFAKRADAMHVKAAGPKASAA